jgi:dachs protein
LLQTNVGPIVLSVNPYRDVGNPLTLTSTRGAAHHENSAALSRVVQEAVRLQAESGYPQAVIVSGASGSGKTHTSMVLLRQLFDVSSGGGAGHETDTFKHLSAAFTVLRNRFDKSLFRPKPFWPNFHPQFFGQISIQRQQI